MSHEIVLAALPHSKDEAKYLKDIAQALALATSTHIGFERNAVSPEFSGF